MVPKVFEPFKFYTCGQKFCMVQFCVAILETLTAHMVKNLNIETEKSEHCLLKLLYLNIKDSSIACATKHFKNHNKKIDQAEFSSLKSVSLIYFMVSEINILTKFR